MKRPAFRLLSALLAALLLSACRGDIIVVEYGEPIPTAKVVGALAADGHFTAFLALLNRPEFGELLNRLNNTEWFKPAGSFTIFAPNDQAFNALSEDQRKALLADSSRLRDILMYHIVNQVYGFEQLQDGLMLPTLLTGSSLTIHRTGAATIHVNDALVEVIDIRATNGVIQEIDQLLLPPGVSLGEGLAAASPSPTPSPLPQASWVPDSATASPTPGARPSPSSSPAPDARG